MWSIAGAPEIGTEVRTKLEWFDNTGAIRRLRSVFCYQRKPTKMKCKTKQLKISKGEEAELYICKNKQKCDGKHAGVRALMTVVGPVKIAITIKKRTAHPTP
jgi:hypothetical protein